MFFKSILIVLYFFSEVEISSGLFKGTTVEVFNVTIDQYLGIPYAEPPLGNLRFAKPKPIGTPIKGIIDATKPKYSCLQPPNDFIGHLPQSEDCLTLNIWSRKENNTVTKLKPVMFWLHGGGLAIGSIYQPLYNGSILATNDVVVVAANYRLGPFGFLHGNDSSAPGNVGFYDQVLALQWVRDNIHLFGGDKQLITLFGDSAGSGCVSLHLISPVSKGLFRRAIMESGAFMYNKNRPVITKDESIVVAKNLAKKLNCSDDNKWLECLRKVDSKYLLPTDLQLTFPIDGTDFLPLTAGKAFDEKMFNKDLDLLAGITRDEGTGIAQVLKNDIYTKTFNKQLFAEMFDLANLIFRNLSLIDVEKFYLDNVNTSDPVAIKWKISDFIGDISITCPTYLFAKRYAKQSSIETNVYFYEFTHSAKGPEFEKQFGITHASELDFVFGPILLNPNTTKEDIEFSKQVMKYWTDFAKYGKPEPKWPAMIDTKANRTLVRDMNPKNPDKYFTDLFAKTCDGFWKNFY